MGKEAMTEDEKTYTSGDVAAMIGIGSTTVRKYALHLEKKGYHFYRSNTNARLFRANDIMAVRYLKELREKTNITVEQAAAIVYEKFQLKKEDELPTAQVVEKDNSEHSKQNYNELKQLLYEQNELLESLLELMNRQQQYIDEQLMIRDRTLMHAINEKLEAQKLAAATAETHVHEKQSLFSKMFKKGS